MQGLTYDEAGDHKATYFINNYQVADGEWSGQEGYTI